MNLWRKNILIVSAALVLLSLAMWFTLKLTLLSQLNDLENTDVRKNVDRAVAAIANENRSLQSIAADRAYWDDLCKYISDKNPDFIDANMTDSTFTYLKVNLMIFVNNEGQIVYAKGFDLRSSSPAPIPPSLFEELKTHPQLLRNDSSPNPQTGLLVLPETPVMMASYPILPGNQEGKVRGTLLVGRNLDAAFMMRLAHDTQLDLSLQELNRISALPDYQTAFTNINPAQPIAVHILDNNLIAGYTTLTDMFGNPALALRVTLPRDIFLQGQSTTFYAALFVGLIGLFFGALTLIFLEKLVLARLFKLSREVKTVSDEGFGSRVSTGGKDELGELAASINHMLVDLEHTHLQLLYSDKQLRRITDNMLDVVAQVDCSQRFLYLSPSYQRVLGYTVQELIGKRYPTLVHPKDFDLVEKSLLQVIESGLPGYCEFRCRSASGSYMWLESMINAIVDDNGQVTGAVLVGRDVTSRKEAEEQIRFISLHDPLTGLYNRTYFEQEMMSLEGSEAFPIGMMICDLDGLKFINDTLGHSTGDGLIITAAKIIQGCADQDSIISRIGGDEYAVIIPACDHAQMESIYAAIKERAVEHSKREPDMPLDISIGFALRLDSSMSMADLFREADNNMYREKLHSHQSGHSGLISGLMQALLERDLITSHHVERIDYLVITLGEALELSRSALLDLRLLGQFHDIGKVGVPDSILLKPGTLTEEERAEMQRHSEIGYRIARAASDLQPVADWILKHHEWWNGQGYPLGLHGKEIPLECRILAICDAYEAMTSDRPYRRALSHQHALQELQLCAGSQFDPGLVEIFIHLMTTEQTA
ncbi:MAG TPA: HD domain-containing phosphohydrolase [Syntrophomonadaceae bacterium]|nr:HD domain-containing phosphohydrolase [Syntrophomonadaceae bacterium]